MRRCASAWGRKLMWAGLILLSLTASCAPLPGDSLCIATRPFYFTEPEIAALTVESKRALAAHNMTWEGRCR